MKYIILILLFIPFNSYSQISEKEYRHKKDSLIYEFVKYEFIKDSLNNEIIAKQEVKIESKDKEIKRIRFKNFILSLGLAVSIIIISLIQ